jgi:stage IV sporulation protein FB
MDFRIGKTHFHISFLFCALMSVMILFDKNGYILTAFLSVTVHECAHIAVMKFYGEGIKSVSFQPFGVIIDKDKYGLPPAKKIIVSCAGCAVNGLISAVCAVIYKISDTKIFSVIAAVNFLLFCVNILPVLNLDGGDIMSALLMRSMPEAKAIKAEKIISLFTCAILLAVGIIICVKVRFNPSLIILSVYLGISGMFSFRD